MPRAPGKPFRATSGDRAGASHYSSWHAGAGAILASPPSRMPSANSSAPASGKEDDAVACGPRRVSTHPLTHGFKGDHRTPSGSSDGSCGMQDSGSGILQILNHPMARLRSSFRGRQAARTCRVDHVRCGFRHSHRSAQNMDLAPVFSYAAGWAAVLTPSVPLIDKVARCILEADGSITVIKSAGRTR